jgi:membrane-associated phospholipid phosphatase
MPITRTITNLGDAALLLPASVVLLFLLVVHRHRQLALAWFVALGACISLTALSKIGFYGCGVRSSAHDVMSPSGHTSLSATFYGCCALLAAHRRFGWTRWVILLLAGLLVASIGVSRVLIQAHTWSEVLVGALVGSLCIGLFHLLSRSNLPPVSLRPVAASFVAAVVLLGGQHLSAEPLIRKFASEFHTWSGTCPQLGR